MHTMRINKQKRDIINIDEVREKLNQYAHSKGLEEEVSIWLQKNLLRWMGRHYKHLLLVQSYERYTQLMKQNEYPEWFDPSRKDVQYLYLQVQTDTFDTLVQKTTEYLSSHLSQKHKFYKMTPTQVLQKWQETHDRMYARERDYIETADEGLEICFIYEKFNVFQFLPKHPKLSLEMAKESALMQHCLGEFEDAVSAIGGYGAYYHELIKEKKISLYTLRDSQQNPHVTISTYIGEDGVEWVDQIKGKQNRAPVKKYVDAVIKFLNYRQIAHHYHEDCLDMGVVFSKKKSIKISKIKDENIKQMVVSKYPALITEFTNPSNTLKWLAMLRDPELIMVVPEASEWMQLNAMMMKPKLLSKVTLLFGVPSKEFLKGMKKMHCFKRVFSFEKFTIGRV